ncbi:RNA polymerase subunit sigma [Achromobacter sp. Root83]|uniref:RNA polymerase sigma factor n=1 Tax=Achromobacter sp. Root83 TaxID=1736602 RepID=UPI00070E4913|nr:RNA polymerase sigma factor [Achromobacter sp. Root83]KRC86116.1 RNA polymerase subunit sigma [Achromobacter sp. Root83]
MLNPLHQTTAPISPQTPEAELVSRAATGDEAAFEAIMRRNNRLLFRTARSILKSDAEAEDALQEAYLRAWRALAGFRAEARLSTWLVRIVVNEALGRLQPRNAQVIPLDAAMNAIDPDIQASLTDDPDRRPEYSAMRAQMRRLLEDRIDLLPEDFRIVFVLRAVEELSVKEVALALDIPEATVRTRYFRARGLLREGLASQIDVALNDAFSFDGARCDRIVAGVFITARQRPPPPGSSRTAHPRERN